jgi:hypothetical protein
VAAKLGHLHRLPQGQPERADRVRIHGARDGRAGVRPLHEPPGVRGGMPEGIGVSFIARMNRDYLIAMPRCSARSTAAAPAGVTHLAPPLRRGRSASARALTCCAGTGRIGAQRRRSSSRSSILTRDH